jgi:hypothetical protein
MWSCLLWCVVVPQLFAAHGLRMQTIKIQKMVIGLGSWGESRASEVRNQNQ